MKNLSLIQAGRALARGINNYRRHRPLCVSFEVTLSCNANCRHCDNGGLKENESQIEPGEYARLTSLLRPGSGHQGSWGSYLPPGSKSYAGTFQ